ncbi:MAG TPA: flagellar assembly protein FliX, partial [Azospirillaceae bacterium]|nr:flagellar assembly protein FliX [Azospirillaceae bacterium]
SARALGSAFQKVNFLRDIRHGLLSGDLSADKLVDLSRLVQSRKVAVDDPGLAQLLDEIDLRAQVELAKFQR